MERRSEGRWKTSWWKRVEGKDMQQRGMEEASENGKESSHSAQANEMNERMNEYLCRCMMNHSSQAREILHVNEEQTYLNSANTRY